MIKTITNVISSGYAIGPTYINKIDKFSNTKDIDVFDKSLKLCNEELDILIAKDEKLGEFILFQKLMLNDPVLKKSVIKYLDDSSSIVEAIDKTIFEYTTELINSPSIYLQERVNDFKNIALLLKENLIENENKAPEAKFILITDELYPTQVIKYKERLLGVITKKGGYTSHSAILCKELAIPYVIYPKTLECARAIIDSYKREIILDYSKQDELKYNDYINKNKTINKVNHEGYKFLANVSSSDDVKKANDLGFDGIGLYRTEFIFYNSDNILSLERQEDIYKEALNTMMDKPITFRTFDIGDDKTVAFIKNNGKGVKNYLDNPDIFSTQIKAIINAHSATTPRILLPMIRTNEEFNYLRNWIISLANNKTVKIGMMLETKEALTNIESFTNVDFISIGTNDLTKELYQRSREKEYDEAITLDLINKLIPIVEYTNKHSIPLSLCGEIASIPEVATRLFEIGIKNLSVTPSALNNLNLAYMKFKNK